VQRQIQLRRYQALVGQTFEVLVEGYQARLGQCVGRTTSNRVLNFSGEPADVGCYRQVRVTSSGPNSLVGARVQSGNGIRDTGYGVPQTASLGTLRPKTTSDPQGE
jgi:tRNA A37 methylthiotransferase MiaB